MKRIFFFANSSWKSLPHRDHYLSISFAKLGYEVYFVEEMPSLGNNLKHLFNSRRIPLFEKTKELNYTVLTPSIIPTFFRSSITRNIDKIIFTQWFKQKALPFIDNDTILFISSPIWFYFLKDRLNNFNNIIYDIHDELEIASRNGRTFRFLKKYEALGIKKVKLVSCSAKSLVEYVKRNYGLNPLLVYNGADTELYLRKVAHKNEKVKIGLVGALNIKPQCYDFEVIKLIASALPDNIISLIGKIDESNKKDLQSFQNIEMPGQKFGEELIREMNTWSACIIPFLSNDITKAINPIKLYEYLSLGFPVIAFNNFDYEDAGEYIYFAQSPDDFPDKIKTALRENGEELINKRVEFAENKSWDKRAELLEKNILA